MTLQNIFKIFTIVSLTILGGCLNSSVPVVNSDAGGDNPVGNNAPIIFGNPPAAATVDQPYSFTPQASDPDGDALTFSIENQPAWASFDSSTGRISGVPTLGNVGSYSNIRVSVSDGQLSASMSGFSIEVTQLATASTTLSWTAPTQNEDGSVLTDLAGYKLYYGQSSGSYTNQIVIDNASITTYMVDNLTPTTYFFAAKSFNTSGVESRFSGEIAVNLN